MFGMDFMHIFQYNQNKIVLWVTLGFYSKQFYLLACFSYHLLLFEHQVSYASLQKVKEGVTFIILLLLYRSSEVSCCFHEGKSISLPPPCDVTV